MHIFHTITEYWYVAWMICLAMLSFSVSPSRLSRMTLHAEWLKLVLIRRPLSSFPHWCHNRKLEPEVHSRSISLLSWCLSQWPVGDSGHPDIVFHQFRQTEDSTVNARRSELLDLPGLCWWRSSSPSQSLEYNIKNVRISTASTISNGRSISFYRKKAGKHNLNLFLMCWQ